LSQHWEKDGAIVTLYVIAKLSCNKEKIYTHFFYGINPNISSSSKTVQVHIVTRNRIFEATLAVSNQQEYEKQSATSINDSHQAICPTLSLPTSLFSQEVSPTKLPAIVDSVRLIMIIVKSKMNV
jgi:hypothetical protein